VTAEASPARPGPTPTPPGPAVRLITVSASYGAGGSVVAPALADRLGLPFVQRVTTSEGRVAVPGPCDERLSAEEVKVTPVHRLLAHFTQAMPAGPTQSPPSTHHQDEHLRGHGEAGIHRVVAAGGGVILGRAAAVVLGKDRGYHVRLDGPPAASCRGPRSRASAKSRPGSACTRPTRLAPPMSAACTAPTRPTRPCTNW
jgi:Cytidylate kinase-like family